MALTKQEIIDQICEKTTMTRKECESAVEATFEIIKSLLESGNDIKISGFGKWSVKHKKERNGRNPKTGESMAIAARRVITFKPSSKLKDELNKED
jgi:integration host factor subunit alpha